MGRARAQVSDQARLEERGRQEGVGSFPATQPTPLDTFGDPEKWAGLQSSRAHDPPPPTGPRPWDGRTGWGHVSPREGRPPQSLHVEL